MTISEAQRSENKEWHRKLVDHMERGYPWRAMPERGVWYLCTSNGQNLARFNLDSGCASRMAAAAPDLLAALKAAQEELWLIRMKDHATVYNPGLSVMIDLAIDKAENPHLPR